MALATLNGYTVIEAAVTLPRTGRWSADVAIDAPSATGLQGAPVTLVLGSSLTFKGTCRLAGEFAGGVTLEVVGGAAGLLKEIAPKSFQACDLQLPLTDVLTAAGEVLAASSDATALATMLPKWIRIGATAAEEIATLLGAAPSGTVARVLPDGTIWIGTDAYLDSGLAVGQYQVLRDDSHKGEVEIGVEEPTLLPGTTFLGRQVEEVVHTVTAGQVRTTVQFATAGSATEEPSSSSHASDLDAIILRRVMPTRFYRVLTGKVLRQNSDGTLEIGVDDTAVLPGLSMVPIRTAGPGVTLQVQPGCRCGFEFENGDPQRPVATMFDSSVGATVSLTLNAPTVNIGATAPGDAAALASLVLSALNAMVSTFNSHTHVISGTTSAPSMPIVAAAAAPTPPAATMTTVASSNLKLQA